MMSAAKPTVSFEFFPPKTPEAEAPLWDCIHSLARLKPAFMTITYGAGGSSRNFTVETAIKLRKQTGIAAGAHLTGITTPKEDIRAIAEELWQNDVRHIVALRGDHPKDPSQIPPPGRCYAYGNEVVAALKLLHDFEISVGAYPEKHPEAPDLTTDIANLKRKCEAGATRAITQFFFDNDVYFRFRDQAVAAGIKTPIHPGVLPILNYERMVKFAGSCKADVPQWLHDRLAPIKDKPDEFKAACADILARQCEDLARQGASHVHFYTLNHDELPINACRAMGLSL